MILTGTSTLRSDLVSTVFSTSTSRSVPPSAALFGPIGSCAVTNTDTGGATGMLPMAAERSRCCSRELLCSSVTELFVLPFAFAAVGSASASGIVASSHWNSALIVSS
ncbi:hypothetical protein GCM10009565_53010 [Amycolatopsis albidoflavus]